MGTVIHAPMCLLASSRVKWIFVCQSQVFGHKPSGLHPDHLNARVFHGENIAVQIDIQQIIGQKAQRRHCMAMIKGYFSSCLPFL
jgi:hypothetical protein